MSGKERDREKERGDIAIECEREGGRYRYRKGEKGKEGEEIEGG